MPEANTRRIAEMSIPRVSPKVVDVGSIDNSGDGMKDERARRLREARKMAGFTSAADAADAFGWKVAGYRHHENGTRGFGLDAAKKYGRAFRVKPAWLLLMDGVADIPLAVSRSEDRLIVQGAVEAGVWREPADVTLRMELEIPAPVPDRERFGLVVQGQSMNLHYEPGTILDCISIFKDGVPPQTGDHVIVERIKPDGLRETTVKEFVERNGENFLVPKSTRPEFQEMAIGTPNLDIVDDIEVRVIGFVVSAIAPRAINLMRRLGKITDLTDE